MPLVLASASPVRRAMLDSAGVAHEAVAAAIDESAMKQGSTGCEQAALDLACAKALAVGTGRPDDWVIGSDSIVSVEGRMFDKPRSREEAEDHLRLFSGKRMRLTSAVALSRAAAVDWSHVETAELQVRRLSNAFIHSYLDDEWPAVGGCVGVFRMEGPGVQLFETVEGSHFTILGMPLIPLLGALRERALLLS